MGIARPRIDGYFRHQARKDTDIVSKCNIHDTWFGINRAVTKRMCAVCVILDEFHKFPLTGKHFNFLGTRVGSSKNSIPNNVVSILKVNTRDIREVPEGTLPTVVFMGNECSTSDSLLGHLGVARQTHDNCISTVLKESTMVMVYDNSCFRVYMIGRCAAQTQCETQ